VTEEASCLGHTRRALFVGGRFRTQIPEFEREPFGPKSANYIGPGQSDRFVISDFARQIAEIKLGRREPVVVVRDINVTRDFTDVRDVVHAYFALLHDGQAGEIYNVCSGRECTIRELLDRLAALAGVEIRVQRDPARLRRRSSVGGDPAKIERATGWRATTPLDESLAAMLAHWEKEIAHG
jgi:GDP-4-dehydro-6-deoxy-D-mannose reductase